MMSEPPFVAPATPDDVPVVVPLLWVPVELPLCVPAVPLAVPVVDPLDVVLPAAVPVVVPDAPCAPCPPLMRPITSTRRPTYCCNCPSPGPVSSNACAA